MNSSIFSKVKNYVIKHKIISAVVLLIIVLAGYKYIQARNNQSNVTRYVVAAVNKGTIVSAVTGTGQVSASSQINLNPKASGNITFVGAKVGDPIRVGQLIAQIDSRSAALDLQNAKLSLSKLTEAPDQLTLLQDKNAIAAAQSAKVQAETDLAKAYDDSFNSMSSAYLDFPTILTGLDNLLNDYNQSPYFSSGNMPNDNARTYRQTALTNFYKAKSSYDHSLADFQKVNRATASTSTIDSLIEETYQTAELLSQAVKDTQTADTYVVNLYVNKNAAMNSDATNISDWITKITSHVQDLSSLRSTVANANNTLENSGRTIAEKTATLTKLQQGADPNDIQAQELSIQQKELAYEDYFVRAPLDGTMGTLNVKVGDPASAGTAIGTFITNKKIAVISLNEVDVAKVKAGDKATLTFDAVPGLSISGQVAEVDLVGTVSQGVVSYNVQIAFDTQDSRVKAGMTVDASIQSGVAQDVITVPASAIKTTNGQSFVQVVDNNTPISNNQGEVLTAQATMRPVQVGISDDQSTEIVSGLAEGDKIITKTIQATTGAQTSSQAPSILNAAGAGSRGGFGGGAAVRRGG